MSELNQDGFLEGMKRFLQEFAKRLEQYRNWYERNAENIAKYLLVFADFATWYSAIDKMAEKEIVFTDDLSIDFAKEIYNSPNVDSLIQKYYFQNNEEQMNKLIACCLNAKQVTDYNVLYTQIVDAYQRKHYQLACTGLFSLIDGVLADVSNMITVTNFNKRITSIENKLSTKVELNELDRKTICIYNSVDSLKSSFFGDSRFSETEPDTINRHWIIHGRTRKKCTQYDFLKILLWLDGIIFLADISSKIKEVEQEN